MTVDAVERIVAAADKPSGRNKAGHSELYEWFWRHYDEVAPALLPPRTPNWREVAAGFAALLDHGEPVRDGAGKAPSVATCRKTFVKVAADKERVARGETRRRKPRGKTARAAPVATPVSALPPPPFPHVAPVPDATAADVPTDEDEIVPRFAGGPKTWRGGDGDG